MDSVERASNWIIKPGFPRWTLCGAAGRAGRRRSRWRRIRGFWVEMSFSSFQFLWWINLWVVFCVCVCVFFSTQSMFYSGSESQVWDPDRWRCALQALKGFYFQGFPCFTLIPTIFQTYHKILDNLLLVHPTVSVYYCVYSLCYLNKLAFLR